jgi:hypothetical protein
MFCSAWQTCVQNAALEKHLPQGGVREFEAYSQGVVGVGSGAEEPLQGQTAAARWLGGATEHHTMHGGNIVSEKCQKQWPVGRATEGHFLLKEPRSTRSFQIISPWGYSAYPLGEIAQRGFRELGLWLEI